MRTLQFITILILVSSLGCSGPSRNISELDQDNPVVNKALLATRFNSLEELMSVIQIEYFNETSSSDSANHGNSKVRLTYSSHGTEVISILESGISQSDIIEVRDGDFGDRLGLIVSSPYAVTNRVDLNKIYILARRRPILFGEGDMAFYDLAESSVSNINTNDLAFMYPNDSTEKGYINTFNHVTAQSFITSIFTEEMADFVADVHERYTMPELTTGHFTEDQLTDPEKNPVDNYVDIINNELGHEIGKWLKHKYSIRQKTWWTPELLADYLNDIQHYYSWSFEIGFKPFRPGDNVVIRFSNKINLVMGGMSLEIPEL